MASTNLIKLYDAEALSATGAKTSEAVSLQANDVDFILFGKVTDSDGTSPTFDIKLQHSHDGVTWIDVGVALTQIAGDGQAIDDLAGATLPNLLLPYVRAHVTLGGTDPEGVVTVSLYHGRNK